MSTEQHTDEHWRDVPGFPGYQVSDLGRVRSCRRTIGWGDGGVGVASPELGWRLLKPRPLGRHGHLIVSLQRDAATRSRQVHRLVLEAFVGPCPEGMETRHLDGHAGNNHLANLRWGTPLENAEDKQRHGTVQRGEQQPQAKLTATGVSEIRRRWQSGESISSIARSATLARSTVSSIVRRQKWRHVI